MAVLRFSVSSDWQEVVRLREEINKLENQLKSFGKSTPETQIKQTEERLANTRQEFTRLTTEAARAGAVMENDFKKKIYDASQTVNDLTSKIIAQRDVVRNVEADVKKLGEAYRNAAKSNPYGAGAKRAEYNSARRVLEEERAALFGLTQQQAKAKLSVRQLQEQYALYKRDVGDAAGANNILANSFRRTLAQLGGAVAIKNFVGDVVKATGTMQQLHIALSTILQDGNKASVLIKQLTLFAAKTQFNLEDVAAGAKQLIAYGSSAETVVDELSMLGDVAAGLQIPIGQLIYLYGTLRTQGRAMTVDIRQFAGRGIPIYEELAKVLGVAKDEVSGLVSEGKVGFAEVEQAFKNMTSEGGKFNDLMENSAGTWPQRLSNLGDTLFQKLNDFGNRYKDTIESGFGVTEALVEHLDDVLSVVGSLIVAYGTYKAAVMAVAAVRQVKNWVRIIGTISAYTKAMQRATVATRVLNTAIKANPIGLIAGAIAGLISLISSWTAKQRQAIEEMEEAIRPMQEEYTQVNNLVRKIQDSNTEERERLGLLEELKNIAPDVTKNINDEADALQKLTDNLEVYNNKQLAKIAVKQFGMQSGFEDDYNAYKEAVTSLRRTETQLYNDFAVIYARFADYNRRGAFGSADFATGGTLYDIINSDKSELEKMQLLINYRRDNKYNDNVRNDMKLLFQGIDFDAYISSLRKARGAEVEYTRSKEKLLDQINNIVRANGGSYELRQELLSLVGLTETPSSTQDDNKKSKVTKEPTDEEKEALKKAAEARAKAIAGIETKLRKENEDATIDAIENETIRKLEALRVSHNREMAELNRQREELKNLQVGSLTPEQDAMFAQSARLKNERYDRESAEIAESPVVEALKAQNEELQRLYTKYKSLISQYEEADARFAQERKMLERDGASGDTLATLDAKREETLNAISTEMAMQNNAFQIWADNLVDMSLEQLQQALTRANQMLTLTEDLSPNSSGRAAQYRAQAAALQEEIDKRKKDKKGGDSPDKEAESDWKDLNRVLNDSAEIFDEIGKQIGGVGGKAISAAGVVAASTVSIINGLTQVVGASAEELSAVEKASAILAVITAVVQAVTKLTSMFAADYEQYNKLKEQYEGLIDIWDRLIERKREYIGIEYGTESLKAAEDTLRVLEKQVEATRQIARERLRSGASAGSHSIGYRMWEGSYKFNGQTWSDVAANIESITGEQFNSIEDLTRMSADSLLYIMENYAGLWAVMDDDVREYLENIIEYSDTSKDIIDETKEALTGITFDDMYNDFLDKLMDMENDTQSFADDVTETLTRAMLNASIENLYKGKLQDWYESFYEDMKDGELTSSEIADLRSDYQDIIDDAIAERDAIASITGYDKIAAEAEEQQATAGAFSTMSEDTGSKLEGRFAALQMAVEDIRVNDKEKMVVLTDIRTSIGLLYDNSKTSQNIANETRDILANSYLELQQISSNTESIIKPIRQIQADMAVIKENTGRL